MAAPVYPGDLVAGSIFDDDSVNNRLLPLFKALNPDLQDFQGGSVIGVGVDNDLINDGAIMADRVENTAFTRDHGVRGEQVFVGPISWDKAVIFSYEVSPNDTLEQAYAADEEMQLVTARTNLLITHDSDPGGGFKNVYTGGSTQDEGRILPIKVSSTTTSFSEIDNNPPAGTLQPFRGAGTTVDLSVQCFAPYLPVNDLADNNVAWYSIGE